MSCGCHGGLSRMDHDCYEESRNWATLLARAREIKTTASLEATIGGFLDA
jgi:hypothetical protein